jgi:hypothetical protein
MVMAFLAAAGIIATATHRYNQATARHIAATRVAATISSSRRRMESIGTAIAVDY